MVTAGSLSRMLSRGPTVNVQLALAVVAVTVAVALVAAYVTGRLDDRRDR